eukprot:m.111693 g.111693  ORF g.111693 m.111693 type:complete len:65 (-) comp13455_c0_seq1:928-1122(-)
MHQVAIAIPVISSQPFAIQKAQRTCVHIAMIQNMTATLTYAHTSDWFEPQCLPLLKSLDPLLEE